MVKIKTILLTFDIEEFDLPMEIKGGRINEEEQFKISKEGTEKVLTLLDKYNITSTFFVSVRFAEEYPKLIKEISGKHEIGLHCLEHKDNYSKMDEKLIFERLIKAKKVLERIINKKIKGFRAPRFQAPSYPLIKKMGFEYDSSLNPTWIPGRYDNRKEPKKIFLKEEVKIIPISVSDSGFPLFWIIFRNFPLFILKYYSNKIILKREYVCLIFHPWEFCNDLKRYISKSSIFNRLFTLRGTGNSFQIKLEKYIIWCLKKNYEFRTISDYLSKIL